MILHPHPFYRRIRQVVREHPALPEPWNGIVFRSVPLEFARPEQILDGGGAMKSGARWNPPGLMRALYCSLKPGTAAEESMRLFELAGLKRATVKPRLLVGIRCRLQAVIELSKLVELISGARLDELMAEEWRTINARHRESLGQAVGRALSEAGVEGLLVPSARVAGATNLVVFPANLHRTSRQQVLETAELQKWMRQ